MIALCDQRSFYASCECVYRPDLRSQPVAVLSNNDGCVVALNELAKALGVKKFEPYFKQRPLFEKHNINVFSSNYALYGEISARIMATLRAVAPRIEVYSIDEAFCDLSGIDTVQLKAFGSQIKHQVWREQRIPMGVSIAPTKTLAKLGQYATKKYPQINGVCVLERPEQWNWLAKRVPVEETWGVGRQLSKALKKHGINTVFELLSMPFTEANTVGHLPLERTVRELNGELCMPMEYASAPKASIVCSRSFGKKTDDPQIIKEAIATFVARAAQKLRAQHSVCGKITVFILTSRFEESGYSNQFTAAIPGYTSDTRRLMSISTTLFNSVYLSGYRYAKAGVLLSDIRPALGIQQDLLSGDLSSSEAVMSVMDKITAKYGANNKAIFLAGQGINRAFDMNQQRLSPSYLSCWTQLPHVKCE